MKTNYAESILLYIHFVFIPHLPLGAATRLQNETLSVLGLTLRLSWIKVNNGFTFWSNQT